MFIWNLLLILVLIGLNGFFVSVEFAAVSSRKARVELLAAESNAASKIVKSWIDNSAARDRLREETFGEAPDDMSLAEKEEELEMLREELAGDQDHLQQLQQELPQLDARRKEVQASLQRLAGVVGKPA